MKIKPEFQKEYDEYKVNNSADDYSAGVVSYTEDWANLMEAELAKGNSIENCAKETGRKANTDGITGFMYSCAVSALAHFWEYGEALSIWHNLDCQIGTEGERANKEGGVLNPALLHIESAGDQN